MIKYIYLKYNVIPFGPYSVQLPPARLCASVSTETEQPTTVGLQRCFAQESNNRQRDSERSTTCGLTDIFPRKGLSPVRQAACDKTPSASFSWCWLVRGCPLAVSVVLCGVDRAASACHLVVDDVCCLFLFCLHSACSLGR